MIVLLICCHALFSGKSVELGSKAACFGYGPGN